jgi:hypothetical protein
MIYNFIQNKIEIELYYKNTTNVTFLVRSEYHFINLKVAWQAWFLAHLWGATVVRRT